MSYHPVLFIAQSPALILAGTFAIAISTVAEAQQQVYRSVDAQGNVSFSAEPPSGANVRNVESIELQPGPSEADRQAAEARARDIQQAADAYAQQRQAAREAAAGQQGSDAASKSSAGSDDASPAAEQWDQLLVNDRNLTPEQRTKVEEAKRELLDAQRGQQGSGSDLYKSPDNYQRGTTSRSGRE
ncbi:DUF4124 domain-containing protein [Thiorhodovibrio frisius]|uniref:DUF4124 domain-containing protein n=1 Tax=Thiorhodovibrio frisius TaxID=631362 RepID=H8Z421_9GAMM|nr:DUF4124 domain-containing protein [Thiorhodovibrio frisius]EIC20090.1 hypothetical protein Thi970DRAFT_03703 [Thiorhodovibrio frisius]WPL20820.1 hypothetical protein Thiofri_00923 [Thiorhodovibrio frisius]